MNQSERSCWCKSLVTQLGVALSCLLVQQPAAYGEEKVAPAADAHPAPAHGTSPTAEPGADIVCEASVTYSWKRRPLPPPPNSRPSRDEPAAEPEPTTEFFTMVGEQGVVEQDTKERVANKIAATQAQAMEECRKLHESQAGCVTDKLRKTAPDYSRLDFAGRKAILDSINADCTFNLGNCLTASAGEVHCRTNRPPDLAPPAAPEPAADTKAPADAKAEGKDKKKK